MTTLPMKRILTSQEFLPKECMEYWSQFVQLLNLDGHGVHRSGQATSRQSIVFIHEHAAGFVFSSAGWKKEEVVFGCFSKARSETSRAMVMKICPQACMQIWVLRGQKEACLFSDWESINNLFANQWYVLAQLPCKYTCSPGTNLVKKSLTSC